jgi:hypothetical protein
MLSIHNGYWSLATNFLKLAEASSDQLVKTGNPHVVISDFEINVSNYQEMTMWSDHSIGISILFNFFHGIELILKGFISTVSEVPNHHILSRLKAEYEALFPATDLGKVIALFIGNIDTNSPLGRFIVANEINIDDWYQALKYPVSTRGKVFNHAELRYGGIATTDFWHSIVVGASHIRVEAVNLAQALDLKK